MWTICMILQATEIGSIIQQKRDLGCKTVQEPVLLREDKQIMAAGRTFWDLLGGKKTYQG